MTIIPWLGPNGLEYASFIRWRHGRMRIDLRGQAEFVVPGDASDCWCSAESSPVMSSDMIEALWITAIMSNPAVPAPGTAHSVFTGMTVKTYNIAITKPGVGTIEVIYGRDQETTSTPFCEMEIDAAPCQIETNKDVHGNLMQLTWTYPTDQFLSDGVTKNPDFPWANPDLRGTPLPYTCKIPFSRTETVLRYTRTEKFPHDGFSTPHHLIDFFRDSCNSSHWTSDTVTTTTTNPPDGNKGMWHVESIKCGANFGGVTWRMSYSIRKRPWGWKRSECIVDPLTGYPPKGITSQAEAAKDFDEFLGLDYNLLHIPAIGATPPLYQPLGIFA